VPYPDGAEATALAELNAQAAKITASLEAGLIKASAEKEIIALIAYLQRLGTDIKGQPTAAPTLISESAAPPAQARASVQLNP